MKQVGLVVKMDDRAAEKADEFETWLQDRGARVLRAESASLHRDLSASQISLAPPDLFCVFVLGGDGTFLSAVRWIGNQDIPILGVKFGEIGFLAEIAENNLLKAAQSVLDNEFTITPRMRLQVRVVRDGKDIANENVLNDVVINRGALARLAHIQTCINEDYLTTYRADGLIVATPTGSTAYSLAAGGPIIHPEVPAIILTPICPFTLTNRPLIVPDTACITIKLEKKPADIMLTFDGQLGLEIDDRDSIIIQKGDHPVKMITLPEQHYFETLKTKLRWGGQ